MTATQPDGYLALPDAGSGPAVLVLHAWWGLNDTVRSVCDRLAEAGFVAFAPDLYHGETAGDIPGAEALSETVFGNLDRTRADVAAAAAYLSAQAARTGSGLAVVGFSLGAFFALDLSVADPEHVGAVVAYYGTRPGDFGASKAAYLGHFADDDDFEPRSEVDNLEAALRRAGRPVDFYRYPGTGHWFCEPDRSDAYNQAAAALAWDRTLAFLKHTSTS